MGLLLLLLLLLLRSSLFSLLSSLFSLLSSLFSLLSSLFSLRSSLFSLLYIYNLEEYGPLRDFDLNRKWPNFEDDKVFSPPKGRVRSKKQQLTPSPEDERNVRHKKDAKSTDDDSEDDSNISEELRDKFPKIKGKNKKGKEKDNFIKVKGKKNKNKKVAQ